MKNTMLITLLGLCTTNAILFASEQKSVTLPLSNILYQRLRAISLSHFADKTCLHETLGGQTKNLPEIVSATDTAVGNYSEYMHREYGDARAATSDMYIDDRKVLMLESILQDHPEMTKDLQ